MIPSVEGLIVSAFLLLIGYLLGAPLIIGLFVSLPFGSTAFAKLTALGGSTPLIYTLFAAGIIVAVALRRTVLWDLGVVFKSFPAAWLVSGLTVYVIVSAMIFPRLFAGQTTAFVPVEGVITELPLSAASGNITQTAYFTLGALTFLAFSMLLLREENLRFVRRAFFLFVIVNASLGIIDLLAKLGGAGDVFLPIRTASYALLTEVEEAGFSRIAGGFSEASAFASVTLTCLAFTYAYWRAAKSTFAFVLTVILLMLVLLSTSSTAYAGLALLSLAPMALLVKSALRNRLGPEDVLLLLVGAVTVALIGSLFFYDERLFDPIAQLIQTTILDKPTSASGIERTYWNQKSLQAFLDTSGWGTGMGSSRSSSWIVSVISQLGFIGTLGMLSMVAVVIRATRGLRPTAETLEIFALVVGARAAILAALIAESIGGSGADPGILFFVGLSTILAGRRMMQDRRHPSSSFAARAAAIG